MIPQGFAIPIRKAAFWQKFGITHLKELLFHKKIFVAISINFGNKIVNKSFGGLTSMEYYFSIFGFDYREGWLSLLYGNQLTLMEYVCLRKLFSVIKFAGMVS